MSDDPLSDKSIAAAMEGLEKWTKKQRKRYRISLWHRTKVKVRIIYAVIRGRSVVYRTTLGRPKLGDGLDENALLMNLSNGGCVYENHFGGFRRYWIGGKEFVSGEDFEMAFPQKKPPVVGGAE